MEYRTLRSSACRMFTLCLSICLVALGLLLAPACAPPEGPNGPPSTRVDVVCDTLHGVVIEDPYRWLEDQEAPETRQWIDAQNSYTESLLKDFEGRQSIEERLSQLMKVDVIGTPVARGGRYFLSKRLKHQSLSVIYMREGIDGEDQVLIDPHTMSEDHKTSVGLLDVSQQGTVLAYSVRQGGEDEIEVRFFDLESRTDFEDRLPRARYLGISLLADGSGFYYTRFTMGEQRVLFHKMGADPAEDAEIFGEGYDPPTILTSGPSGDARYLVIVVLHGAAITKTELYYKDIQNDGPIVTIVDDIDARFWPEFAGDYMLLHTNWDAPNGRVIRVPLADPNRENWMEIVPESDAVIQSVSAAGGKVFVNYLENVRSKLAIVDIDGESLGEISFPSMGTVSGMAGRWSDNEAFFAFSSFHIPTTIYRYDVQRGEKSVWSSLDVPIDSESIEVSQVWYTSKDGTEVPMFLVCKRGLVLDGNNPVYLTGYGGFGVSLTPRFSSSAVVWIEHGGVFAIPNLRGGGELGEEWHQAGMFEKKQNVFDDFIAAAEWLIENKYTNPERIAIRGGSNGGLLVGAVMTQRPKLFGAVVCTYPVLDMLRYHMFSVASYSASEYGCSDDPDQFKYIYEYSPYHNVKKGTEYPAVLFITGDADTRVAPLHARKMTALLQAATSSDKHVLLKYDTKTGHSGGMPVDKQIEDATDTLSFLFWQLGMAN